MSESTADTDPKRKRILWGVAIGWFSFIPLLYGCLNAFKGISEQKATGLGAVAGGIAEGCAIFGALVFCLSPMIAIYLLVTSWSRGYSARNLFSVVTMLWSGLTLFLILERRLADIRPSALNVIKATLQGNYRIVLLLQSPLRCFCAEGNPGPGPAQFSPGPAPHRHVLRCILSPALSRLTPLTAYQRRSSC